MFDSICLAAVFRALGDPSRLAIVEMLAEGEQCACKLLERFQFTQPTLSYHMKLLVDCKLVNARRDGRWQHYSLSGDRIAHLKRFFESLATEAGR